jgi:hypothetical protein
VTTTPSPQAKNLAKQRRVRAVEGPPASSFELGDRLISDGEFRRMAGDPSHMWIKRRDEEPPPGWPKLYRRGRRRCRKLSEAVAFINSPAFAVPLPRRRAPRERLT